MCEIIQALTVEQYKTAAKDRLLVPVSLAALLTGISRQRLYKLIEAGRVGKVVCYGQTFVDLSTASQWYRFSSN